MKRKMILVALFLLTVIMMCIGSVGAYMRKQTEVVENVFVPAKVSCVVNETFQDNKKTNITITNTGTIKAYLRLRLVTYWVDSNGNILFETSPTISVALDKNFWVQSGDTYYYKEPVGPGESTEKLLENGKFIQLVDDDDNGKRQVVEVFAEAIQSKPTEAVTGVWPVVLDSDDMIKALQ